jgi:hypothetical protein
MSSVVENNIRKLINDNKAKVKEIKDKLTKYSYGSLCYNACKPYYKQGISDDDIKTVLTSMVRDKLYEKIKELETNNSDKKKLEELQKDKKKLEELQKDKTKLEELKELQKDKKWLEELSENEILKYITNLNDDLNSNYKQISSFSVTDETGKTKTRLFEKIKNFGANLYDDRVTIAKNSLKYDIHNLDLENIIKLINLIIPVYSKNPQPLNAEAVTRVNEVLAKPSKSQFSDDSKQDYQERKEDQAKIDQMNAELNKYDGDADLTQYNKKSVEYITETKKK